MSKLWFPNAERVGGQHVGGLPMAGGKGICTHHITATAKGTFDAVRDYLVRIGYEPTLLLDPWTGRAAQFLPADRGGYALEHPSGGPLTNTEGDVHVQIEWLWPAMPNRWHANDITRAPQFPALWAELVPWLEALGVPSLWTFGGPMSTSRSPDVWRRAGHRGHRNAPLNSHSDGLATRKAPPWAQDPPMTEAHRILVKKVTKVLNDREHRLDDADRKSVAALDAAALDALKR